VKRQTSELVACAKKYFGLLESAFVQSGTFVLPLPQLFDVLTSIVSFIWAPSTRGGVAYGVRTLSTNRNSY
jgi:hypothetical protein